MSAETHSFCRAFLSETMREVRKRFTADTIKHSWGYKYQDGRNVEFQINNCNEVPDGFFWNGRGCCVWDAKAHGWLAFMKESDEK